MALRTIDRLTLGSTTVRTVYNPEYSEYMVQILRNRKVHDPATYFTNDKQDALDTMRAMYARLPEWE